MRIFFFCLFLLIHAAPAYAVDIKALGRPLDDDSKAMMDRYVYFDKDATAQNVAVNKPVLSQPEVLDWLTEHLALALTLDWKNYTQQVAVNRRYFTPAGYGAYTASLNAAQLEKLMTEKKYTLRAVIIDAPRIVAKGLRRTTLADGTSVDTYVWQTRTPVMLTYDNTSAPQSYKIMVIAEISRIPPREDGAVVALSDWTLAPMPAAIDPLDSGGETP